MVRYIVVGICMLVVIWRLVVLELQRQLCGKARRWGRAELGRVVYGATTEASNSKSKFRRRRISSARTWPMTR